jgi:tryptophan synthase alpha chain
VNTTQAPPQASRRSKLPLGIYWTLGDPNVLMSQAIAQSLVDHGVALLELGLPFSDPLLDGTEIQQSHHRALASGLSFADACACLEHVTAHAHRNGTQVSLMTASQLLFDEARRSQLPKLDGLLVTDLSSSRSSPFSLPSPRVYFVSQEVVLDPDFRGLPSDDFSMIYLTRLQGITGSGQQAGQTTAQAVQRLVQWTPLPIWLGFGISSPQDLESCLDAGAHGGIIGSAFVSFVRQQILDKPPSTHPEDLHEALGQWLAPFRRALEGR